MGAALLVSRAVFLLCNLSYSNLYLRTFQQLTISTKVSKLIIPAQSHRSFRDRITAGAIHTTSGSRTAAAQAVRIHCRGWEPLGRLAPCCVLLASHAIPAVRSILRELYCCRSQQQPLPPNYRTHTAAAAVSYTDGTQTGMLFINSSLLPHPVGHTLQDCQRSRRR